MSRWVRVIMVILAACIGAYAGLIVIGGGAAGIAWIFLFGDDPWPRWSEIVILLVALIGAAYGAIGFGLAAWRWTGKYQS